MKKVFLFLLAAVASLSLSTAHAESALQGLEMDVMDANETPSQAAARISLPRPGVAADTGLDYADSLAGQVRVGSGLTAERVVDGPITGIAVGEPGPADVSEGVDEVKPDIDPGTDDIAVDTSETPIDPSE